MKNLFGMLVAFLLCCCVSLAFAESASVPCNQPHIQAHLALVLSDLRSADVSELSESQRTRRAEHIERLDTYRTACSFPQNDLFEHRITPIFVDNDGTHCAVGHLLALDGETALVEDIRATLNTASIWELAENDELQAWLTESGLSLYEAARIQPAYCTRRSDCLCRSTSENFGVALGVITALDEPETEAQEGKMEITEQFGRSTFEVGDIIDIGTGYDDVVGRRVLATLSSSLSGTRARRPGSQEVGDETVRCESYDGWNSKLTATEVPIDTYVNALLAEDCVAAIGEYDPKLIERECSGGGPEDGCRSTRLNGASSLLAIATFALIAFRRRRES